MGARRRVSAANEWDIKCEHEKISPSVLFIMEKEDFWLADIFTRKNIVFLHVKIYGISQWQKSL